jgi:hypothetical protein
MPPNRIDTKYFNTRLGINFDGCYAFLQPFLDGIFAKYRLLYRQNQHFIDNAAGTRPFKSLLIMFQTFGFLKIDT